MKTNEKPFYKSKKLWAAVAIVLAGLAEQAGISIPDEALLAGIAYILGQGLADLGKNAHKTALPPQPVAAPPTTPETPAPAIEKAPVLEKPSEGITPPETEPPPAPERKSYWEMTPEEAEAAYFKDFQDRIDLAKAEVELTKDMPGEVHKHALNRLEMAEHSLKVARPMVEAIKNPQIVRTPEGLPWAIPHPDSIGPLGYRIANVPEAVIPSWVKVWLKNNP